MKNLSKSAQKIQSVLDKFGLELKVIELTESTRTSKDAAGAIGCEIAQIAKSLIFKGEGTQKPVLVIASGANRVDEKKIQGYMGEEIEKAEAAFVLEHTGFVIGGVPPIGHLTSIKTFIDECLLKYPEIWSAAGTPHTVFKLTPDDLLKITQGQVVAIK